MKGGAPYQHLASLSLIFFASAVCDKKIVVTAKLKSVTVATLPLVSLFFLEARPWELGCIKGGYCQRGKS